jgi:hypothetical protein
MEKVQVVYCKYLKNNYRFVPNGKQYGYKGPILLTRKQNKSGLERIINV